MAFFEADYLLPFHHSFTCLNDVVLTTHLILLFFISPFFHNFFQ